jgi:hypothetical protein
LGLFLTRNKTKQQQDAEQQQKDLLDTQDLAATLFEQSITKDQEILDLQELVAQLFENGGAT